VDEVSLAQFFARKLRLEPAGEDLCNASTPTPLPCFHRDRLRQRRSAPVRQRRRNAGRGLVDPTDGGLLTEVGFFAGFNLSPRLITVSQMARHFARLSGTPWKIGAEAAAILARHRELPSEAPWGSMTSSRQTTALEVPFETALSPRSMRPTARPSRAWPRRRRRVGWRHIRALPARPDLALGRWRRRESLETIRLRPIGSEAGAAEIEVGERELDERSSRQPHAGVVRGPARGREPFVRVSVAPADVAADDASAPDSEGSVSRGFDFVEGEAATSTGKVRVLGFNLDAPEDARRREAEATPVPIVTDGASEFRTRVKSKVPARPPSGCEPAAETREHFALLTRLAAPSVGRSRRPESIEATARVLEGVRMRDEIGDAVVAGFPRTTTRSPCSR